jgi:hypothetical protein
MGHAHVPVAVSGGPFGQQALFVRRLAHGTRTPLWQAATTAAGALLRVDAGGVRVQVEAKAE